LTQNHLGRARHAVTGIVRAGALTGRLLLRAWSCKRWAPSGGALLIDAYGVDFTVITLTAGAVVNLLLVWILRATSRPRANAGFALDQV
jgi:hypothetical protein